METRDNFESLGEVVADERSRIAFGKAGVRKDDRYAIAVSDEGEILLTPLASIPKRELLIWENSGLRASLARGLEESSAGKVASLGTFAEFLEESDAGDD
jgi:hypothetical protein